MQKLRSLSPSLNSLINKLENYKINPFVLFFYIFFVIQIRNFLECFSDINNSLFTLQPIRLLHYTLWFFVTLLLFSLVVSYSTKQKITKTFKIFSFFLPLIWLAPILDLIFRRRMNIGYFRINTFLDLIRKLFLWNIGDSINNPGMTFGMGIEVLSVFCLLAIYLYFKNKSFFKTALTLATLYLVAFFMGSFPFIIPLLLRSLNLNFFLASNSFLQGYGLDVNASTFLLSLLIPLLSLFFYFYDKNKFVSLCKYTSWVRVITYLFLLNSGIILGMLTNLEKIEISYIKIGSILLANFVVFALWIFSKFVNDYFDQKEDSISNPQNPFLNKSLSKSELILIYSIVLFLIFLISLFLNFVFFFICLLILGITFIYSCPPLRIKKFVFISHFCIGLVAGLIFIGGLFLIKSNIPPSFLENQLFFLIVLIFSFGSNLKDIKDYKGDKKGKIITLPTLFGEKIAKIIISGIISVLFFLSAAFFDFNFLFPFAIIGSLLVFYFNNKKDYFETPTFLVYLTFFLMCSYRIILKLLAK